MLPGAGALNRQPCMRQSFGEPARRACGACGVLLYPSLALLLLALAGAPQASGLALPAHCVTTATTITMTIMTMTTTTTATTIGRCSRIVQSEGVLRGVLQSCRDRAVVAGALSTSRATSCNKPHCMQLNLCPPLPSTWQENKLLEVCLHLARESLLFSRKIFFRKRSCRVNFILLRSA